MFLNCGNAIIGGVFNFRRKRSASADAQEMNGMTNSLLPLAKREEIVIGFTRPDGSKGSTPIWDVEVAGEIYVRSGGGLQGGWYRRLRHNPDGEVHAGRDVYPVHAEPVEDVELQARVTTAYRAKYGHSPFARPFFEPDSIAATLHLTAR
jgi:hypothetical protein